MPTTSDASPWATAVRQRRKALLQRLGMGAAAAFVFSPVLTWDFAALWVAGYFLVQLIDLWVFGPVNAGKVDRMGPLRMVAANIMLVANALYFGSLSVALWYTGGPMGGICAAMLLSSGAIYAVVNAPRSNLVLALSIAPQFLYLGATPFFMLAWGASPAFCTAMATGIAVFVAYCLSVWRQMERARTSEAAARLDADRRRVEAEAAMNGRSAFLAAVGHDLRTPIGAIMSGAMEIERTADGASRAQARLIADAGLMMKALLDDLLDHAKLEAGRMTVDAVDFDLRALTCQTLQLWQGPVRAKGLRLRLEGASSLPRGVRGDPMRLRQILNNLISNAVKFTRSGSVTLRLSAWEEDGGLHAVVFEVADTGPGMTADQVARLFTPFDQTADGVGALHGGTGLGLAISRELVGLMGGRLTVRSRPGEGAAFTVAVTFAPARSEILAPAAPDETGRRVAAQALRSRDPIPTPAVPAARPHAGAEPRPQPAQEAEAEAEDADGDEGRAMKVLVVDDHDINRRAVQLILAPLGVDVTTAEDGMAALRACEQGQFDMIFMDVRMPELDGRETTRRLRASGGINAAVPVIAVTADTSPDDVAACLAAGMSYFVPKPITPPALLGAVQHVLAGLAAGDAAPAEVAAA
ncbi:MAG: response regulator [Alphaproteobacteria bacterium]|nr:response regulator [Alphaproteobacteria bacterium]MBU1525056.1 response regulator [Alphaproteobacteria bacterium]MBU2351358.1 response regulator [Alphaproteobacteria bacterium]MBU2383577.1 response regulator [Alphaproteobacteria bacterium]